MTTAKDSSSLRAAFQQEVVVQQNLDHLNVTKVILLLTDPLLAIFILGTLLCDISIKVTEKSVVLYFEFHGRTLMLK